MLGEKSQSSIINITFSEILNDLKIANELYNKCITRLSSLIGDDTAQEVSIDIKCKHKYILDKCDKLICVDCKKKLYVNGVGGHTYKQVYYKFEIESQRKTGDLNVFHACIDCDKSICKWYTNVNRSEYELFQKNGEI